MVRAGPHLAVGAIAAALILAGGGAVAAADPTGESAASDNANAAASSSGAASSTRSADTDGSGTERPTATFGGQADRAVEQPDTKAAKSSTPEEPKDQPTADKPAADKGHGTDLSPGKTVREAPVLPEAPPPMDVAPLPEAPPVPPPVAPPPPALPASPVDPNVIDSIASDGGHHPVSNEPPVLTVPVFVAPAPIPAVRLGASIAPRGTASGRTVESQSGGEAAPQLMRASTNERLLNESSFTSFGVTSAERLPYLAGYREYASRPLATMAAGALPGLAGLVLMTAAGICLGYRQATMAQQLRSDGAARFLA